MGVASKGESESGNSALGQPAIPAIAPAPAQDSTPPTHLPLPSEIRHQHIIAAELGVQPHQVEAAAGLLAGGATVPFIARYRKEATGSLDEVAVAAIRDRMEQLTELDKRREAVLRSLAERELLTEDLRIALEAAASLS